MGHRRSLRDEIEYRLGLYFGLKSGALYVRDEKYGNQESVMKQLECDIARDVKSLAKKEMDKTFEPDLAFRYIVLFYKNFLMKK